MDIIKKLQKLLGEGESPLNKKVFSSSRKYLIESFESAEKIELAIDTVQQKIAAEKDPKEKERLQERLIALKERWIEALRAGRDQVKKGAK